MQKQFYVSGFLYHSPTQQILLQQQTPSSSSLSSPWFLFSSLYTENEDSEKIFKKIIYDLLGCKLDKVNPVYSYSDATTSKNQVICYAELDEFKDFPPKNGLTFGWFTFKDILKLQITEQTKHDIVVGQRVIDAASRESRGEHTFQ